jgi:hypothetical protein
MVYCEYWTFRICKGLSNKLVVLVCIMESQGRRSPSGKFAAHPTAALELPSGKYHGNVPEPPRVLLQRAAEPAHPVLPRQQAHKLIPNTMRERVPLASSLNGTGRAGAIGSLSGSTGSRYIGQVLAGRPHGQGKYYVQARTGGVMYRLLFWVSRKVNATSECIDTGVPTSSCA